MLTITIIDCGVGNLTSIQNMLTMLGVHSVVTQDPDVIAEGNKFILPGVGAFDAAMAQLKGSGILPILSDKVLYEKKPLLGICLGMQLLASQSEEGREAGLDWIPGEVRRFSIERMSKGVRAAIKIPHMGWNHIVRQKEHGLFTEFEAEPRFYFVHSYHYECVDSQHVLATTNHGYQFASVIGKENILGAQFHPEKSHRFGLQLLENFCHFQWESDVNTTSHTLSTTA